MKKKVVDRTVEQSRRLRGAATDAERKLWTLLSRRQFHGIKFRRQVPFGTFIADFASHEARLIVELDGGQHDERADYDARRTAFLNGEGYRVLRFWNNDVLTNPEGIIRALEMALEADEDRQLKDGTAQ